MITLSHAPQATAPGVGDAEGRLFMGPVAKQARLNAQSVAPGADPRKARRLRMVASAVSSPPIAPAAPAAPSCTTQDHEALKCSERWCALCFRGYQGIKLVTLELRDCPLCGSTLARPVRIVSVEYTDHVGAVDSARGSGEAA